MTTKEKILRTSLKLFAQNGYEAVSVSQIASELGITKGAIYKHYESKRHIFDSILRHMEQRDAQQAAAHHDTRESAEPRRQMPIRKDKLPGRNDPCPCGSGKKFKNCHGKGIV